MTLIELMVVIVILLTLVAVVLPMVSPNNDARKIAEAARGLQTYFMQAQAEAARIGRPVGVGFRESQTGSGVAIEAFQMVVPPPFAGFDQNARVQILYPDGNYGTEGINPKGGTLYLEQYNGLPMYKLSFVRMPLMLHPSLNYPFYPPDPFPRDMLKVGDVINLEGNEFLIADCENNMVNVDPDTGYLYSERGEITCIWINNFGQQPPDFQTPANSPGNPTSNPIPGTARAYRIFRQPASTTKFGPSSESANQLPAGIAIDLHASGLEADDFVLFSTLDINRQTQVRQMDQSIANLDLPRSVAIMFAPSGGIESVWSNGVKLLGTTRAFLMVGRLENGLPRPTNGNLNQSLPEDRYFDFYGNIRPIPGQDGSDALSEETVRESRQRINWLNMDSRWLVINGADGRLTVNENASFNPLDSEFQEEFKQEFNLRYERIGTQEKQNRGGDYEVRRQIVKQLQIEEAHAFVHGGTH